MEQKTLIFKIKRLEKLAVSLVSQLSELRTELEGYAEPVEPVEAGIQQLYSPKPNGNIADKLRASEIVDELMIKTGKQYSAYLVEKYMKRLNFEVKTKKRGENNKTTYYNVYRKKH